MKYNKHLFEAYVNKFSNQGKKEMFIDMLGFVPEDLARKTKVTFYDSEQQRENDINYTRGQVEALIYSALEDFQSKEQHIMNACGQPHFDKMVNDWIEENLK